MCHITFVSTTSEADFRGVDEPHFHLYPVEADEQEEAATRLSYPHRWYLEGRYGGCSCHFRNWVRQNPPEFWEPQDWFEEDPEDVEATRAFYDLIARLVGEGEKVDIVTVWEGEDVLHDRELSLSEVSREAFRFMDSIRFDVVR